MTSATLEVQMGKHPIQIGAVQPIAAPSSMVCSDAQVIIERMTSLVDAGEIDEHVDYV